MGGWWVAGGLGWLVGWLGWLVGWLAGWLVGCLVGWLVGWLAEGPGTSNVKEAILNVLKYFLLFSF